MRKFVCENSHTCRKTSASHGSPTCGLGGQQFPFDKEIGEYHWVDEKGTAVTAPPTFLSRLCDADLAALAKRWTERNYRHNELIVARGDTGRDVFFLLKGRLELRCFQRTAERLPTAISIPVKFSVNLPASTEKRARPTSSRWCQPARRDCRRPHSERS